MVEKISGGRVPHFLEYFSTAFLGQTNCAFKSKNRVQVILHLGVRPQYIVESELGNENLLVIKVKCACRERDLHELCSKIVQP